VSVETPRRHVSCGRILVVAALFACGPRDARDELPAGALVGGDARALQRVLAAFEGLPGTPLARAAETWRARLEGCGEFQAAAPRANPDELLGAIRCSAPRGLPDAVLRLRGDADLVEDADERARALSALRAKYAQYRLMDLESLPLIRISPVRVVSWAAAPAGLR